MNSDIELEKTKKERSKTGKINNEYDSLEPWMKKLLFFYFTVISIVEAIMSLTILFLPTILISHFTEFNEAMIPYYYVISVVNVGWIILLSWYSRQLVFIDAEGEIQIKDKTIFDFFLMGIQAFSDRTIMYTAYAILLILSQLNEFNLINIVNKEVLCILNTNQQSIVLLAAFDQIVQHVDKDKITLKDRFEVMVGSVILAIHYNSGK